MPRLTYQTAIASLIQFIGIMILGIPDTIINIASTCHSDSSNCVSNTIVSLIFYLLTAGWFAIIMLLGYAAQRRRSRQFAVILAGFEFITLVVAGYIDFPHDTNILAKGTSLLDA
jgi:predicted permease